MKKILCILCFVFCASASFAAGTDETFISCGRGYTTDTTKSQHGILTLICNKVWCVDLENGRSMGSGNNPKPGYESTTEMTRLCDNSSPQNCVDCFGKRKWCDSEKGIFTPEVGAYTKGGNGDITVRGVLEGSSVNACYKWHDAAKANECGKKGEIAVSQVDANGELTWVCLKKSAATSTGRSAIKSRALRRTAGPAPVIKKR